MLKNFWGRKIIRMIIYLLVLKVRNKITRRTQYINRKDSIRKVLQVCVMKISSDGRELPYSAMKLAAGAYFFR